MIHFSMGSGARPRHGKILPQDCEIRLLTAEEGLVASGLGRNGDSLILNVTAPARLAGDYPVAVAALSRGPLCLVPPILRDADGSATLLLAEGGLWACNAALGEAAITARWLLDGQEIANQGGARLEPGPDHAGRTISYSETADQPGRTAIAVSPGLAVPPGLPPQAETVISALAAPAETRTAGGDRIGGIAEIAIYRDIANYAASNGATIGSVAVEVNGTARDDAFALSPGDVVTLRVTASDGTIRRWPLSTTQAAAAPPAVLTSRAYPTGFGTLTYDISAQIPGAEKATGWAVSGPNAITIADGVLSFNSDAIQPGALTLTGRAEGADNDAWTLAVTFEAIAFSYDGADSVIVSYPADTPADGSIGFTPTGGEQDGRAITFTPADLDGLADGAGFAALAPLVSIAADGGTAGSVDAGDTIALDTPALYLYGGTEPTISYSAHDDGGVVEADITFPWTAPSGMSGSLSIVADDGFGNTAASASIPVVGSPVSAGNLLDLSQPIAGSSPDTWQTQSLSPLVLKPTGSFIVGRGGWPFDVVAGQTYRITWNLSINESASGHSVRLLPDSSGNGTPLASSYNPVGTLDYTATQTRRLWVGPALQKSNALRVTVNTYGVEKI